MLALAEAIFEIGAQDDFGNTPGSAGLLAVNGAIAGEIEQAGDQDWFAVELEQGASYRFNMRGDSSDNGTLSDGILLIRDSEGSVLAYNNNSGIGTDARLSFTAEESGTFFLDARGVGDEIGTYVVDADLWSAPPPPPVGGDDDVGNTPETAGTLELGQELTGTIENKNDHDWFAVELEAGQNYRLIMRGEPSDGGTLADAYLALRDGDGDVLKSNNNSGIGTDARMSFTAEETGTHYLDAGAVGDHTGTYTVEARTWGTLPTPAGEESGSFEFASVSDEEEVSNSLDVFDL